MAANSARIDIIIDADDRASAKVKRFGSSAEDASGRGRRAFGAMDASARALMATMGALAAAAGAAALVKRIVDIGAAYESTMATVRGVMRATEDEFARLDAAARKMGETTEWSAAQSADALKYMGMAGMTAAQAVEALPGILDLATAAQMDLSRAADIATDTLTAMGMEVDQLGRLNDVLVATTTRSNTTVELMGSSLKYVAPLASQAGYDIEQVSAAIGVLANSGIKGEQAGTGLTQVFLKLESASAALGIQSTDLESVMTAIGEAQWSATQIAEVFGSEQVKTVGILRSNMGAYADLEAALRNSGGEAKTLADTMRDTLRGAFQSLGASLESVALELFDRFGGGLKTVVLALADFVRESKASFLAVVDGAIAFGDAALAPIRSFVESNRELWINFRFDVEEAWAGFLLAAESAAGASAALFDRVAGPVRDFLSGLVESASGATSDLSAYFERFRGTFENLFSALTVAAEAAWTGLSAAFENIGSAVGGALSAIFDDAGRNAATFGETLRGVFEGRIIPAIESFSAWIVANQSGIESFFTGLGNAIAALVDTGGTVVGFFADLLGWLGQLAIVEGFVAGLDRLGTGLGAAAHYLVEAIGHISDFISWLTSAASAAIDTGARIVSAIAAIPDRIVSAVDALAASFDAAFEAIVQSAIAVVERVVAAFRAIPDAVAGIAADIKGKFDGALGGVKGAVDSAVGAMGGAWERAKGLFGGSAEFNIDITGTGSTRRPITEKLAEVEGRFGAFAAGLPDGAANIAITGDAGSGPAPFTAAIDGARAAYEARMADIAARRQDALAGEVAEVQAAAETIAEAREQSVSRTAEAVEKAASRVVQAEQKAATETVAAHRRATEDRTRLLEEFGRQYERLTLDTYDLELRRLDEQRAAYEQAGADKLQVAEWYWREYEALTQSAFEAERRAVEQANADRARLEDQLYRDLGVHSERYSERKLAEIQRQVDAFRAAGLEETDIAQWKAREIAAIQQDQTRAVTSQFGDVSTLFQRLASGNVQTWGAMANQLVSIFGSALGQMNSQSGSWLSSLADMAGGALGGIWDKVKGAFSGDGIMGKIGGAVGGLWDGVKGMFSGDGIMGKIGGAVGGLFSGDGIMGKIGGAVGGLWDGVKGIFGGSGSGGGIMDSIGSAVGGLFGGSGSGGGIMDSIGSAVGGLFGGGGGSGGVLGSISGLFGSLGSGGSGGMLGAASNIFGGGASSGALGGIANAIGGLVGGDTGKLIGTVGSLAGSLGNAGSLTEALGSVVNAIGGATGTSGLISQIGSLTETLAASQAASAAASSAGSAAGSIGGNFSVAGGVMNVASNLMSGNGIFGDSGNEALDVLNTIGSFTKYGGVLSTIGGTVGGWMSDDAGQVGSGIGAGAGIGATVGSIIPGLGTAVGAAVGAIIGGIASAFGASGGEDREMMAAGEFGFRDRLNLGSHAVKNSSGNSEFGRLSLEGMQQAQEAVFGQVDNLLAHLPEQLAVGLDRAISRQTFDVGGEGYNIREEHVATDLATNARAVVYDMWREAVLPGIREFGHEFADSLDDTVYSADMIGQLREYVNAIDEEHAHGITTSQEKFEEFLGRMDEFQGGMIEWVAKIREIDAIVAGIDNFDATAGAGAETAVVESATLFQVALDEAAAGVALQFAESRARLSELGVADAKLNELEGKLRDQATAAVEAQFEAQRAALFEEAEKAAGQFEESKGLSSFEAAIQKTEGEFQGIADAMHQLGGDAQALNRVQDLQTAALSRVRAEFESARGEIMRSAESLAGMARAADPIQTVAVAVDAQFDALAARMTDLGATSAELASLEDVRYQALVRQTGLAIFGEVDMASILKSGIDEGMAAMAEAGRRKAELETEIAATVTAISEATTFEELAALDEKLAGYRSALASMEDIDFSIVGQIVNEKIQESLTTGMRDFAIAQVAGNIQSSLVDPFVNELTEGFLQGGFNIHTMQEAFDKIQSLDVSHVSSGIAEVFAAMESGEQIDWQAFADKYGVGLEEAFGTMVPTEEVQTEAEAVATAVGDMAAGVAETAEAMTAAVAESAESATAAISTAAEQLASMMGTSMEEMSASAGAGASAVSESVSGMASAMTSAAGAISAAASSASSAASMAASAAYSAQASASSAASAPDGSFATGAWNIPADGFLAELHAGEAVIRREDAPLVRRFLEMTGLSGKYGRAAQSGPIPSYAAGTLSAEPPTWLTPEAAARWAELQQGGATAPATPRSTASAGSAGSFAGSSAGSSATPDTGPDDIARIMEEAARLVAGLAPRTLMSELADLGESFADLGERLREAGGSAEHVAELEALRAEALSHLGDRISADLAGPLSDMTEQFADWAALNIGGKTREGLALEKADAFRAANPDMDLDDLERFVQLEQAAYEARFDRLSETWSGWAKVEDAAEKLLADLDRADPGPVLSDIPARAGESIEDVSAYVEGMAEWLSRASALRGEFSGFAASIRSAQADIAREVRTFGMSDAGKARLLSRDIAAGRSELSGLSGEDGLAKAREIQGLVMDRYELEKRQIADVKSSVESLAGLTDKIRQKVFDLQYSDFNLTKGVERQEMAARDYDDLLRAARGGDADAMERYLGHVDTYLKESQSAFKSSERYGEIFAKVNADLTALGAVGERRLSAEERRLSGIQAAAERTNVELDHLAAYAERQAALIQESIDTETANMEALFGEGGAIRIGQEETRAAIDALRDGLTASIEEMKNAVVAAVSESGDRPVSITLELDGRALTDNIVADIRTRTKNREQVF